jgi:PD-(D/E)XK endonuclease
MQRQTTRHPNKEQPRDTKRTGEVSEAAFLHKAVGLGLRVTKPWGDSERYDFVVDAGGRMWRVQIKCTAAERPSGGYRIHTTHSAFGMSRIPYTAADIDVLAAHIIPLDLWYVVPVQDLDGRSAFELHFDGFSKLASLQKYHEAWGLFRGEAAGVASEDQSAEVTEELDPVHDSIALAFARWRPPVWKPPRFFGR